MEVDKNMRDITLLWLCILLVGRMKIPVHMSKGMEADWDANLRQTPRKPEQNPFALFLNLSFICTCNGLL